MAWEGLFKEAATTGKRELTVKKEDLSDRDADAIQSWSDLTLFKVRGLNRLQLSGFLGLKEINSQLAQLSYLQQLILTDNGLETLPEELGQLTKLRMLDASNNRLALIPRGLYLLPALQTLQLGHNQLTTASFPPWEGGEVFPSLQHINMVDNQLTELPAFVYHCSSLAELVASDNKIALLSESVGALAALKQLDLKRNQLTSLPSELGRCTRLRGLGFEENPLQDKRLVKVLDQFGAHRPKMVLDYLSAKQPRGGGKGKKSGKGKGRDSRAQQQQQEGEEEEDSNDIEFSSAKLVIRVVRPAEYVEVLASPSARSVRPYLVCAVVRQLDLAREDALRTFLTLQTKLHETVCKRRRLATIATHDLSSLSLPLFYSCAMAAKIKLQPLGWKETATAAQFLTHVEKNKPDASRGGKKVYSVDAAAAQLSKYLTMVDKNQLVYLVDSTDNVASLPPLTNCEPCKITEASQDVLLEVTSATSLADAKTAMDTLLVEMLKAGLCSLPTAAAVAPSPSPSPSQQLVVEQARVIDGESKKLLVLYPSRMELVLQGPSAQEIEVVRP